MKQKRIKTYLKYGILILGIVFLNNACEKDITVEQTLEENNNAVVPTIKTLSKDNVGQTFNNLSSQLNIDPYLQLEQKTYMAKLHWTH